MKSRRVLATFTSEQWRILESFRGTMGNSDAEIVRNIVIAWLSEKSLISSTAKSKLNFSGRKT